MRTLLVLSSLFVVASTPLPAGAPVQAASQASLSGVWEGAIDTPGAALKIVATFRSGPDGPSGTIDIPQQGATGLTLRALTFADAGVRFELATGSVPAVFDGRIDGDRLSGTFTQGPFTGTFTMTRRGVAPAPLPAPPPYRVESLSVRNGAVTLAGTLTRPDEPRGPVPAVVLLTGSGPQNRDEEIFGFKVFATIADHLTRQGIAVYRYDDRGVGESTGTMATTTAEDFAGDALAAVARLKTMAGIDPARIGLVGHSEGGTVAAIAAARSTDVGFIVMLAGTAVPGDQVLRQQARDGALANGATPAQVDRIVAAHRAVTDGVLADVPADDLSRRLRALIDAQVDAAPGAQLASPGDRDAYVAKTLLGATVQMRSPWMKSMLGFDPAPVLRQLRVPVFAVFGALDMQVPPSLHEAPARQALAANQRATLKVYPEANHLFQRAKTGRVTEYASLDKAFVLGLLDDVARWILDAGR